MASPTGAPRVLYLGDALDQVFGPAAARVVCPITDPFVRHHGALGGFVRIHLTRPDLPVETVAEFVRGLPGVALALPRQDACARFELPEDREGDLAIIADKGVALGARASEHDLSQLAGQRLRSHGGLAEQIVPFTLSRPLRPEASGLIPQPLRNYDVFALALNAVEV
jgi:phosphonoacetate hydrolase